MTTKNPTAANIAASQVKIKRADVTPSKPLKPTKWGVDLLVKMEAFRQALATQK
jgi:hypothetical protein